MLRMLLTVACSLACLVPAGAMVGDAPNADAAVARHVVLIVGSRGTSCTGVAVARDLVLTAAHCVLPGADYKLVAFDTARRPTLLHAAEITRHPQFDLDDGRAAKAFDAAAIPYFSGETDAIRGFMHLVRYVSKTC